MWKETAQWLRCRWANRMGASLSLPAVHVCVLSTGVAAKSKRSPHSVHAHTNIPHSHRHILNVVWEIHFCERARIIKRRSHPSTCERSRLAGPRTSLSDCEWVCVCAVWLPSLKCKQDERETTSTKICSTWAPPPPLPIPPAPPPPTGAKSLCSPRQLLISDWLTCVLCCGRGFTFPTRIAWRMASHSVEWLFGRWVSFRKLATKLRRGTRNNFF